MPRRTTVYMPDELAAELDKYDVNLSQMFTDAARQKLAELKAERRAQVRQQATDLGQATALEFIAQAPVEAQETLAASGGVLPVPSTLGSIVQDLTHGDPNLKTEFYSGWNSGTVSAWQRLQASTVQPAQPGAAPGMKYTPPAARRVAQAGIDYSDQIERDGVEAIKRLQDEGETERASGKAKPSAAGA